MQIKRYLRLKINVHFVVKSCTLLTTKSIRASFARKLTFYRQQQSLTHVRHPPYIRNLEVILFRSNCIALSNQIQYNTPITLHRAIAKHVHCAPEICEQTFDSVIMDELPYKIEYARTGRAGCKGCKLNIGQDSLRIARMVQVSANRFVFVYTVSSALPESSPAFTTANSRTGSIRRASSRSSARKRKATSPASKTSASMIRRRFARRSVSASNNIYTERMLIIDTCRGIVRGRRHRAGQGQGPGQETRGQQRRRRRGEDDRSRRQGLWH